MRRKRKARRKGKAKSVKKSDITSYPLPVAMSFHESLSILGFSSYGEYLKSDLWRRIRATVLMEYHNLCILCGNRANIVHHRDYSHTVMCGDDTSQLFPLCNPCHKTVEFTNSGKKRTLKAAQRILDSLLPR